MVTIVEAKQQSQVARSQLEAQKLQVSDAEIKAQQQKDILNQAQKRLPSNESQRALRQKMEGLQGRMKRRQIEKVKQNISGEKFKVSEYEKGIEDYKNQLRQYEETQLKPFEESISSYEIEEQAIKTAQKYADARVPLDFVKGQPEYKYLKEIYERQSIAKQEFNKSISEFQQANPTEKLKIDWKNLKVTGVQSGTLGETLSVKDYNAKIGQLNIPVVKIEDVPSQSITVPTQLSLSSDNTNLNNTNALKINGIKSNVPSGSNVGNIKGFLGSLRSGVVNLFGGSSDFKKGDETNFKKTVSTLEPYNASKFTGKSYETPKPTILGAIIKSPGLALASAREFSSQQATLISAEKSLGLGNVGTVNDKIININKVEINKISSNLNSLDNQIRERMGKLSSLENKGLTNSPEYAKAQEDYRILQNKRDIENQRYDKFNPVVKLNLLGTIKDVESRRISNSIFGTIVTYSELATSVGAKEVSKGITNIATRTLYSNKEPESIIDMNTGIYRQTTPEDLSSRKLYFKEQVGSNVQGVVEPVLQTGKYFIPVVGERLFYSSVGESLSKYNYNPISYVRENPVEAGLMVAGLTSYRVYKGGKYLFSQRLVKTGAGFKISSRADDFFGKRVVIGGEDKFIKVNPSKEGKYFQFEDIVQPRASVKASESVGIDFGKKIIFGEQKLSASYVGGQRTIVKIIKKGKERILYEGVPYKAPGQYKNQLEYLMEEVGLKENAARSILRYSTSKGKELTLKEGVLNLRNNKASGKFTYVEEKPVIMIDKKLGIKTRGGKSTKTTEYVYRVGLTNGLGVEKSEAILTNVRNNKNILDIKGFNFEEGLVLSRSSGDIPLANRYKSTSIEQIESISIKKYTPSLDKTVYVDTGKTTLIKIIPKEEKISTVTTGGKKSSQEFLQQMYSPELKIAPKIKEVTIRKSFTTPKTKLIEEVKSNLNIQSEISGLPIGKSSYAGTGLYEQTDVQVNYPQSLLGVNKQSLMNVQGLEVKQVSKQKVILKTSLKELEVLKESQGLRISPTQKNALKPNLKEITMEKQVTKVESKLLNLQKSNVKTTYEPLTKTIQRNEQEKRTPQKLKPKIKIISPEISDSKQKRSFKDFISSEFKVFVRKKGKDFLLGEFKSEKEAETKLRENLLGTLRASGFVERSGRKIDVNLGRGFTKSKIESKRIVQERSGRLGSFGERKEIKGTRKKLRWM